MKKNHGYAMVCSLMMVLVSAVISYADDTIVMKGFSVVPPAGWKVDRKEANVTFSIPERRIEDMHIGIGSSASKTVKAEMTPDDFAAKVKARLAKDGQTVESEEGQDINGFRWKKIRYSSVIMGQKSNGIITVTVKEGVRYSVLLACPADDLKKVEPVYDRVVKSMVLHPSN